MGSLNERLRIVLVAANTAALGCVDSASPEVSDEAAISDSACAIFDNQTGSRISPERLARLNDPVVRKILAGGDCPRSYREVLQKLDRTDARCPEGRGLGVFLVNETVAFAGDAEAARASFRTVITKECDGRDTTDLLFSGSASVQGASDVNVEMIGRDATTGIFNFYEVIRGGQWVFYGDSADFVSDGYDCKPSGYCVSLNSRKSSSPSKKSCASCHVSGGLLMKELDSPWLHWTSTFPRGSEKVVEAQRSLLGAQRVGEDMEFEVVRKSFAAYSKRRVTLLARLGISELLRPLFCTMDVNLSSQLVGANLVVDEALERSVKLNPLRADLSIYDELKKEVHQRILGVDGADDTRSPFTFPSRGQIDIAYSDALVAAKLVDSELVKDVLAVDFTRPIFSGQRCRLLDILQTTAPIDEKLKVYAEMPESERAGAAPQIARLIAAAFVDALRAKSPRAAAEEELLRNLTEPSRTAAAHQAAARAFLGACNARLATDPRTALKDVMTYASHLRRAVRRDAVGLNGQDLLEGRGADRVMVADDIPDDPRAFDPTTCRLELGPESVGASP